MDPEVFKCPICIDVVKDAVEVECCGHIFCNTCINDVHGTACPHCRTTPYKYHTNMSVRRALENTTLKCINDGCDYKSMLKELNAHAPICTKKEYACPFAACTFKSTKSVFAAHIADAHVDSLVQYVSKLCTVEDTMSLEKVTSVLNDIGRVARPGENGKYYCGGKRECACEVLAIDNSVLPKICGYQKGCNCQSCMSLDVKARQLPKRWFVNEEGSPCQLSCLNDMIYCGRRKFPEESGSQRLDAYCGPRQGPQCKACEVLQKHVKDGFYV